MVELNFCSCGKIHVPKKIREAVKKGEKVTANILPQTSGIAKNVLKWGCGALNIDASRIGFAEGEREKLHRPMTENKSIGWKNTSKAMGYNTPDGLPPAQGRFPANLVLSGDAPEMLDAQSGHLGKSLGGGMKDFSKSQLFQGQGSKNKTTACGFGDSGGASRFFYCAKISKSERNAGCETGETRHMSTARLNSGDKSGKFPDHDTREKTGNHHPTVKPKKLMAYLIRMVTPPNGTVLDPFMGSGSTGIAAKECGFDFIGIERDAEYHEIASKRIESAVSAGDL